MTAAVPGSGVPRKRSELALRVVSSLVLAPVAVVAVYLGTPWFDLLIAVLAVLMAMEWARMAWGAAYVQPGFTIAVVSLFAVGLANQGHGVAIVAGIGVALLAAVAVDRSGPDRRRTWILGGVAYIAVPCAAMIWLRGSAAGAGGFGVVLWLMLTVWGTDIAAYAVGRTIGGPKLAPAISPGKTWSGLAGGMAGAGAVSAGVIAWFGFGADAILLGVALGAATAVVAQAGDLFESGVKRRFGAKDSGSLIPGHGGVLDRLDGLLAAAPATAAVLWFWGGEFPTWR